MHKAVLRNHISIAMGEIVYHPIPIVIGKSFTELTGQDLILTFDLCMELYCCLNHPYQFSYTFFLIFTNMNFVFSWTNS